MAKILNAPKNGGDWPRNASLQDLDGKHAPPGWPWPPPVDAHLAVPIKHRFLQRLVWWARDSEDANLQPHQDRILPAEMDLFELVAYALQRFLVDRKIEAAKMGAVTPFDQAFSVNQAAEEGACGSLESVRRRSARCLVSPVTLSAGTAQDLVQAADSWFDDADCVNRRSLPPIPSEGCQPNRSKAATRWVISTQGLHCYSERAVPVNFAWRFRMDSPLRLIL